MKTKTEKEHEREIKRLREEDGKEILDETGCDLGIADNSFRIDRLKTKLSGYKLAREEFNKKVEELKRSINDKNIDFMEIEERQKRSERFDLLVFKEINKIIDKIFGEKKSK